MRAQGAPPWDGTGVRAGRKRRGDSDGREAVLTQRNKFALGDTVELVNRGDKPLRFTVTDLRDGEDRPIPDTPHPTMCLHMSLPAQAEPLSILRRVRPPEKERTDRG